MELIRVYATSPVSAVAGAITGDVLEYRQAEVQAVGADAVNQAVQGLVLATSYLKCDGISVTCIPEFSMVTEKKEVRTAIKLLVKPASSSSLSPVELSAPSTGAEFAPVSA
jgi:stage V sporulation protein S